MNELVLWAVRYSHGGVHLANLLLQLHDITLWATALTCVTLAPAIVEFAYFAGFAGAGMALPTPDVRSGRLPSTACPTLHHGYWTSEGSTAWRVPVAA